MVFNWISSRWQFVARRCKVIKMVDDMVALLKKEQQDDDDKKEMCEMQLDKAEDDLKVLETTVADLEKSIADGNN